MKIGSSIFSLTSRYLNRTSRALQTSLERLSSGKRINSAKDDVAGLSMSVGLDAQVRGTMHAIRNANDGMSMLSVAEGAMNEMTNVLQSIRELALQAANGTLSSSERSAINDQVLGLIEEYDRIASQTDFNGIKLLDGTFGTRALQIGDVESSQIDVSTADLRKESAFQKTVGTGTFEATKTFALSGCASGIISNAVGDLNGDGTPDAVIIGTSNYVTYSINIMTGKPDGSYERSGVMTTTYEASSQLGDVNGDGILDLVTGTASKIRMRLGNGDGTFKGYSEVASGSGLVRLGDLNGDGSLDIVTSGGTVFIGNGDGTFKVGGTYSVEGAPEAFVVTDLNGDNILDFASVTLDSSVMSILIGNGDGSFKAQVTYETDMEPYDIVVGDLNRDGILDVVTDSGMNGTIGVFLGNGDGSFKPRQDQSGGGYLSLGDVNGDGVLDLLCNGIMLGNGDGSFKAAAVPLGGQFVDVSGDGVLDLVGSGGGYFSLSCGRSHEVTALGDMDITSQAKAASAIDIVDSAIHKLASERANLGSTQNQLESTMNSLYTNRENLSRAYSEIIDADVAQETAELVRQQILQQAGIAVLAQSNVMQASVLELLRW